MQADHSDPMRGQKFDVNRSNRYSLNCWWQINFSISSDIATGCLVPNFGHMRPNIGSTEKAGKMI